MSDGRIEEIDARTGGRQSLSQVIHALLLDG
jgi:hypothetical protein